MRCWIVLYSHRHGTDVWPLFQEEKPTDDEVLKGIEEFEPDRGEYIEIFGPFEVPGGGE